MEFIGGRGVCAEPLVKRAAGDHGKKRCLAIDPVAAKGRFFPGAFQLPAVNVLDIFRGFKAGLPQGIAEGDLLTTPGRAGTKAALNGIQTGSAENSQLLRL